MPEGRGFARRMEAGADLRLFVAGQVVLDDTGFRLLQGVRLTGCLMDAVRVAGVPYRTAWDRLKTIERTWGEPVVATASGGSRGGTSHLTAAGERLLAIYTGLRRDHARCLETLNARLEQEWNRPLRAEALSGVAS